MHQRILCIAAVFVTLALGPLSGHAEDDAHGDAHGDAHHKSAKSVENLSPELRALLKQEMQALQQGMIEAIPAYTSGDLPEVARIAQKMKDSFILKQAITRKQMHELHMSLPRSFLKMDHQFHYYAGMLAHVAEARKMELINFYFSKLTESCAGCHSEHAKHRFPGFSSEKDSKDDGHHDH